MKTHEENSAQQLDMSLTKKWFKFFFPRPAILIMIVFGFLLFRGEIGGTPISTFQDWVRLMMYFYTFTVLPFDVVWAILKKIGRFIMSCAEEAPQTNSDESPQVSFDLEQCWGVDKQKLSIAVKKILSYSEKRDIIQNSAKKKQSPEAREKIFNQKMRNLSVNTSPIQDDEEEDRDFLRFPEPHFEDAAHMFYTQSILYKKNPTISLVRQNYNLLFANANKIMRELCEAKIIKDLGAEEYKFLVSDEQELEKLINDYYKVLTEASIEEVAKIKSKINEKSTKEPAEMPGTDIDNLIRVDDMEGHEFEHFCAELLKKNGFKNVRVTSGSGDQGIDVLATKDSISYGIQCKCYSSDVGNKAVQEAIAGRGFYDCHIGAVLTNRFFTQSARELAKKEKILLWDRAKLRKLIEDQKGEKGNIL